MDARRLISPERPEGHNLLSVLPAIWDWLKALVPLVTGHGGEYASARVEQEKAKARLINSQAKLIESKAAVEVARAREMEFNTSIRIAAVERVWRQRQPEGPVRSAEEQATGEVGTAFANAEALRAESVYSKQLSARRARESNE